MPLSRRTPFVVAAFASFACSSPTSPRQPSATVIVQRDTVVATRTVAGTVTWLHFTVPVAIQNAGRVPLRYISCASTVQTQVGGSWDVVWSPICALGSTSTGEIPAGETRQVTVDVYASVEGPGGPVWRSARVAGTYRLAAGIVTPNTNGPIPTVVSNTFTLSTED